MSELVTKSSQKKSPLTVPSVKNLVASNTVAPTTPVFTDPIEVNKGIKNFPPIILPTAPAWFYSAINLLVNHKSSQSSNNSNATTFLFNNSQMQSFDLNENVLYGSDVNPYSALGQTTLFSISYNSDANRLDLNYPNDATIMPISVDISNTLTSSKTYSNLPSPLSSAIIDQIYQDMISLEVWKYVNYCYTSTDIPNNIYQTILSPTQTAPTSPAIKANFNIFLQAGYYYNTQNFTPPNGYPSVALQNNYRVILNGTALIATDKNNGGGNISQTLIKCSDIANAATIANNAIIIPITSVIVYNNVQTDTSTTEFNAPTFYIVDSFTGGLGEPFKLQPTAGSIINVTVAQDSSLSTVFDAQTFSFNYTVNTKTKRIATLSYPGFSTKTGSILPIDSSSVTLPSPQPFSLTGDRFINLFPTNTGTGAPTANTLGDDIGTILRTLSSYSQSPIFAGSGESVVYNRQTWSIMGQIYEGNESFSNQNSLIASAAVLAFSNFLQITENIDATSGTQDTTNPITLNTNNGNGVNLPDILTNKYYGYKYIDNAVSVFENLQIPAGSATIYPAIVSISSATNITTNTEGTPFAPSRAFIGTIESVNSINSSFAFIPAQDSLYIDETFYTFNFIPLGTFNVDPSTLPYAPEKWNKPQFIQLKNKYNPYTDQVAQANPGSSNPSANKSTGVEINRNNILPEILPVTGSVPLFQYMDGTLLTNQQNIFAFNTGTSRSTYLSAYNDLLASAELVVDESTIPADLKSNIIIPPAQLAGVFETTAVTGLNASSINATRLNTINTSAQTLGNAPTADDLAVANNANLLLHANRNNSSSINSIVQNTDSLQSIAAKQDLINQQLNAQLSTTKINTSIPIPERSTNAKLNVGTGAAATSIYINPSEYRRYFSSYGYTLNNGNESYLVQIVLASNTNVPPFIVDKADNLYDPYYAIFTNLKTFVTYKMRVIVPFIIYSDVYNFTSHDTTYNNYDNFNDKTVGYTRNPAYNTINLSPYIRASSSVYDYMYTNIPYRNNLAAGAAGNNSIKGSERDNELTVYFFVRDVNYKMEYKLMRSTYNFKSATRSLLQCFGGGDLIPIPRKLNIQNYDINKKSPSHLYKFSQKFSDHNYISVRTISIANTPYFIALTQDQGVYSFISFSINATAGSTSATVTPTETLTFPTEFYIAGAASTTLTNVANIGPSQLYSSTGDFNQWNSNNSGTFATQFRVITYNNLVYLIRAVQNIPGLNANGDLSVTGSGLLIDTFVPNTTGNLVLAQEARFKRSGLKFFGNQYTPETLIDSLDNLDYTDINSNTFYCPTIFIPINQQVNVNNPLAGTTELYEYAIDASKGFVADISSFLGQVVWTFIYSEYEAIDPTVVDANGNPTGALMFSLQKLHFIYDPIATIYPPVDFSHKYTVPAKQQILGLTDKQIQEGICYSTNNLVNNGGVPGYNNGVPQNISYGNANINAILQFGILDIISIDGSSYNIKEGALQTDQTGQQLVSTVTANTNMIVSVLFEYNDAIGRDGSIATSSKGLVCLNGYLNVNGYTFTSPDHFDVNDIKESQLPTFELFARLFNVDVSIFNLDISLPRDFWTFRYDFQTPIGGKVPTVNYQPPSIPPTVLNTPEDPYVTPSTVPVDRTYSNRFRSLLLTASNSAADQMAIFDTYNSIVSIGVHQQNNVIGSLFLNKKAERNIAALGTSSTTNLLGLTTKYDFFIFSRDHYETLAGASFQLIDNGYAMVIDQNKNQAFYYVDTDGNYYESYTYIISGPNIGVETNTFNVKVALATGASPNTTPPTPETPNNANPQDIVTQINSLSKIVYAVMGPSAPGLAPAFLPIHVSNYPTPTGSTPIFGPPGTNGYPIGISNPLAVGSSAQVTPIFIANLYVASSKGVNTYPIAGATTVSLLQPNAQYFGSLQYGLDLTGNGLGSSGAAFFTITNAITAKPTNYIIYGGNTVVAAPITSNSIFYPISQINNTFTLGAYDNNPGTYVLFNNPNIQVTQPQNHVVLAQQVVLPAFQLNFSNGESSYYTIYTTYTTPADTTIAAATLYELPQTILGGAITSAQYPLQITPTVVNTPPLSINISAPSGAIAVAFDVTLLGALPSGPYAFVAPNDPDTNFTVSPTLLPGAPVNLAAPLKTVTAEPDGTYWIAPGSPLTVDNVAYGPISPQYLIAPNTATAPGPLMFAVNNNVYLYDNFTNSTLPVIVGNGNVYPVNTAQFIINDVVYIIDQNTNPYTVVFSGQTVSMDVTNTQFDIDGNLYTYNPTTQTVTGQYNLMQSDVIVINDYVYQLDILNAQVIGNGSVYPITTNGKIYSVVESDLAGNSQSYTVTKTGNSNTVSINNIVYTINNTSVSGIDPLTGFIDNFPITKLKRFIVGSGALAVTYTINSDDTVTKNPLVNPSSMPFPINDDNTFIDTDATINQAYTIYDTIVIPMQDPLNVYPISSNLSFTLPNLTVPGSYKTYIIDEGMVYASYAVNTNVNGGQFSIGDNTYTIGTYTANPNATVLSQVLNASTNAQYIINQNSFQINGINYTIDTAAKNVVGNNGTSATISAKNTFTFTAASSTGETYTITYDSNKNPISVTTPYKIIHNALILSVNNDVYMYNSATNVMVGNGTTFDLGEIFTATNLSDSVSTFTIAPTNVPPTEIAEQLLAPVTSISRYRFQLNNTLGGTIYTLTTDPITNLVVGVTSSPASTITFSNITLSGTQYIIVVDGNGHPSSIELSSNPSTSYPIVLNSNNQYQFTIADTYIVNMNSAGLVVGVIDSTNLNDIPTEYVLNISGTEYTAVLDVNGNPLELVTNTGVTVQIEQTYVFSLGNGLTATTEVTQYTVEFDNNGLIIGVTENATNTNIATGNMLLPSTPPAPPAQYQLSLNASNIPQLQPLPSGTLITGVATPPTTSPAYQFNLGTTLATNYVINMVSGLMVSISLSGSLQSIAISNITIAGIPYNIGVSASGIPTTITPMLPIGSAPIVISLVGSEYQFTLGSDTYNVNITSGVITGVTDTTTTTTTGLTYSFSLNTILYTINAKVSGTTTTPTSITYTGIGVGAPTITVPVLPIYTLTLPSLPTAPYTVIFNYLGAIVGLVASSGSKPSFMPFAYSVVIPNTATGVLYTFKLNSALAPTALTASNPLEKINASNQFTSIDQTVYQIFNTEGYNFAIPENAIYVASTVTTKATGMTYTFKGVGTSLNPTLNHSYTVTTTDAIITKVVDKTVAAPDYFAVSPAEFQLNGSTYVMFTISTGTYLALKQFINPIAETFSVPETVNGAISHIVYTLQPAGNNILTSNVATGTYPVLPIPTFFMNGLTFTINASNTGVLAGTLTDSNYKTYTLFGTANINSAGLTIPTKLLTIAGNIYLLDTSVTPHQFVGNGVAYPVTVNLYGEGTFDKNTVNYTYFGEEDYTRKTPRYILGTSYLLKTMDNGINSIPPLTAGFAPVYYLTKPTKPSANELLFTVAVPPEYVSPASFTVTLASGAGSIPNTPIAVTYKLGINPPVAGAQVFPLTLTTPIVSPPTGSPNNVYFYFTVGKTVYIIYFNNKTSAWFLYGTFLTIASTTYTLIFDPNIKNQLSFMAYYTGTTVVFIPIDNVNPINYDPSTTSNSDISPLVFVDRGNAYQFDNLLLPTQATAIYKLYDSNAPAGDAYNPPPQVFSIAGVLYLVDEYIIMNTETIQATATSSTPANPTGLNYSINIAGNGNLYPVQPKTSMSNLTDGVFTIQTTNLATNTPINTTYEIFGSLNTVDTTLGASASVNGLVLNWITYSLVDVEVNDFTPNFTQSFPFNYVQTYPLTIQTGGYNAFSSFVTEEQIPVESFSGAYTQTISNTNAEVETLFLPQGDFTVEFWHTVPTSGVSGFHPFQYNNLNSGGKNPNIQFIDFDFNTINDLYISLNGTVMHAPNIMYPNLNDNWRHIALAYVQPYSISCNGAGYEVVNGSNFNLDTNQNMTLACTFAVDPSSPPNYNYGLLYKGSGSSTATTANVVCSYRLFVNSGQVILEIFDDNGIKNTFTSSYPAGTIKPGNFYQLIVTKTVNTGSSGGSSTDPFAPPFSVGSLNNYSGSSNFNSSTSGSNTAVSGIKNPNIGEQGSSDVLANYLSNLGSNPSQTYTITFGIKQINTDGSLGTSTISTATSSGYINQNSLTLQSTGSYHLVLGEAFDDNNNGFPLIGQMRDIYLLKNTLDPNPSDPTQALENLSTNALIGKGLLGYWHAQYNPNNVIENLVDPLGTDVAISTNTSLTTLMPILGLEYEGSTLYVNGEPVGLTLVTDLTTLPSSVIIQNPSLPSQSNYYCYFNATTQLKLQEISIWSMARQNYQIMNDLFGRLNYTLEPNLVLYFSGSITLTSKTSPYLPMSQYIDNIPANTTGSYIGDFTSFSHSSIDLAGCPEIGRCGPLLSPNLYTPPIFGITVADTVPSVTSYAITITTAPSPAGTVAGEINEAYVYVSNGNLNLYTGKKIGDLTLQWVSQEQGNVQILGFIEGAPPCPIANLTVKSTYSGATTLAMTATSNVSFKYTSDIENSSETKWDLSDATGVGIGLQTLVAPFGIGVALADKMVMALNLTLGVGGTFISNSDNDDKETASVQLVEADKFSIKLQGSMAPITNDQYMASINTLSTASNTPGNPSAKTAILPNPNFGGFTSNNPPTALPKTLPNDEKFGTRIFMPSPYGQAYVTSQVLDVYQQTLVQTNTVYGFVKVPNPNIPPDNNIVAFRLNSQYIRPGCLDGVIGYTYNPATLPNGTQTYTTSTGEMNLLNDSNFQASQIGNNASYMQIAQAYQLKKQIDLEAYNNAALYNTAYNARAYPGVGLTNPVDFYNEYVWTSRGGTEEIKHNYTTSYEEVYTVTNTSTNDINVNFNAKISCTAVTVCDLKLAYTNTNKFVTKYSIDQTLSNSFDMTISLDGIETDTQMRNASNNDAHFILNNNSQFNVNNNSGLNLVSGSDGLVYNIVPSVQSGAGLPTSNNLDDSFGYTQPLPSYTSGSTTGLTGNLEPYDRPGKTKQFRMVAYFLQPTELNNDAFWNTVVDPIWLANSPDADAAAMRTAQGNNSIPWRILYRVTYSERFLPPLSSGIA